MYKKTLDIYRHFWLVSDDKLDVSPSEKELRHFRKWCVLQVMDKETWSRCPADSTLEMLCLFFYPAPFEPSLTAVATKYNTCASTVSAKLAAFRDNVFDRLSRDKDYRDSLIEALVKF